MIFFLVCSFCLTLVHLCPREVLKRNASFCARRTSGRFSLVLFTLSRPFAFCFNSNIDLFPFLFNIFGIVGGFFRGVPFFSFRGRFGITHRRRGIVLCPSPRLRQVFSFFPFHKSTECEVLRLPSFGPLGFFFPQLFQAILSLSLAERIIVRRLLAPLALRPPPPQTRTYLRSEHLFSGRRCFPFPPALSFRIGRAQPASFSVPNPFLSFF